MGRGWGRARGSAMLILMATVEARTALFVGLSDDRLVEVVVRFGVFILVLVVVVVAESRGGGIVLPMKATPCQSTNQDDDLSGMRRVMSGSCWMSRHSPRMLARELPLGKAWASLSDRLGGRRRARKPAI